MSPLTSQWVQTIAQNIAAYVIIVLIQRLFSSGKKLLTAGKITENVKTKFQYKQTPILITLWLLMPLIPIAYNSWQLYRFLSAGGPPSRSDVLVVFILGAITVYWLWKIRDNVRRVY